MLPNTTTNACSIYRITHTASGRAYIGKTHNGRCPTKRFAEHEKADSHIGRVIRKYGHSGVVLETLLVCDESMVDYYERECIRAYGTLHPGGFNHTTGGDGAAKLSEESAERHRVATKEAMNRPEVKVRQSAALKESWAIPEIREKRLVHLEQLHCDTTIREKQSISAKTSEKAIAARERINSDPAVREKRLVHLASINTNPAVREKQSISHKTSEKAIAQRERLNSPEAWEVRRNDPEYREKQSTTRNDPEYREKQSTIRKEALKNSPEARVQLASLNTPATVAKRVKTRARKHEVKQLALYLEYWEEQQLTN